MLFSQMPPFRLLCLLSRGEEEKVIADSAPSFFMPLEHMVAPCAVAVETEQDAATTEMAGGGAERACVVGGPHVVCPARDWEWLAGATECADFSSAVVIIDSSGGRR